MKLTVFYAWSVEKQDDDKFITREVFVLLNIEFKVFRATLYSLIYVFVKLYVMWMTDIFLITNLLDHKRYQFCILT
jgi:hypothetical protein